MVTQKDIANRLNVSRPLVSLVLNGKVAPKQARPEVIEAIKNTAEQMGYQRNLSALAFVSGSHQTIGVYLRQMGTEVSGIMHDTFTGITSEAERHHQKLWVKIKVWSQSPRQNIKTRSQWSTRFWPPVSSPGGRPIVGDRIDV